MFVTEYHTIGLRTCVQDGMKPFSISQSTTLQSILGKRIGLHWSIFMRCETIPTEATWQMAVCIVISSSILSHFNGDITSNCALQAVDIVNCHWLVSQCSIGGYDCRHALFSVGWKVGSVLGPSARPKLYRNIQPSTVLMTPKSY